MFSLALSIMLNARAHVHNPRAHSVAVIGSVLDCAIACLGWSNVTALRITQVTAIEEQ